MIYLDQVSTNIIFVVVDDLITITDPIYLFRFVNEQSNNQSFVELVNTLTDNPRADKFSLTLPTDLDLETGDYEFNIYQSDTPGDEDFENMLLLTTGRAIVNTNFDPDITYPEQEGDDVVYKDYEPS